MIVKLSETQTNVSMSEVDRKLAIQYAYRMTLSPHEWEWTQADQELMARYCLWACQRLDGISQLAIEDDLKH